MDKVDTTKPWDKSMKWLVRRSAQALVSFLVDGGVFLGDVERELQIPKPSLSADSLCKVLLWEQPMVLHVEFQRNRDELFNKVCRANTIEEAQAVLQVQKMDL